MSQYNVTSVAGDDITLDFQHGSLVCITKYTAGVGEEHKGLSLIN